MRFSDLVSYLSESNKPVKTGIFKDSPGNRWHKTKDGYRFESADGTKEWWVEGKRHRLDGPAVEYADGYKEWWVNGKKLTKKEIDVYVKQQQVKDIVSKNNQSGWEM